MNLLLNEIQGAIDSTLRKYGVTPHALIETNVVKIDYTIDGHAAVVEFKTEADLEVDRLAGRVEELLDRISELEIEIHSHVVNGCRGHECSGECGRDEA